MLQGINFDVEEGETAVLLGLNGAGKTTTVATIAGLLKPGGGTIRFDGERHRRATARRSSSAGASRSCPRAGACSRR